jgi:hypothetical protein
MLGPYVVDLLTAAEEHRDPALRAIGRAPAGPAGLHPFRVFVGHAPMVSRR